MRAGAANERFSGGHLPGNDPDAQPSVSLEARGARINPPGTLFRADGTGATFLSRVKDFGKYSPRQLRSVKGVREHARKMNPELEIDTTPTHGTSTTVTFP